MHVGHYMVSSGDRRYGEPGSLTFRLNERTAFVHDIHTIAESVASGFDRSDFCLFPCEPNWIYPICNHYGMTCLAAHDAAFGTTYVPDHLPRWQEMLDREFTDESGSYIGLRSQHTGIEAPFPAGEAGFAWFANCFAPDRARRLWAVAREELRPALVKDGNGAARLALPGRGLDPGNYRFGHGRRPGLRATQLDPMRIQIEVPFAWPIEQVAGPAQGCPVLEVEGEVEFDVAYGGLVRVEIGMRIGRLHGFLLQRGAEAI